MTLALYLVFFLSGAAGLIYESIWSRYLGLFVGHSAYAQIIVMVIFLGGMSAGAALAGWRSTRIGNPLFAYAAVEGVVGLIALLFHPLFLAITSVAYATVFPSLAGSAAVTAAKWTLAGLLILPQSVLLGATFPLMSAGVLRLARGAPGRVLALLYFTNSLGGALGVLLAGFYLIEAVGLPGTLTAAGMVNLLAALATLFVVVAARHAEAAPGTDETPAEALARPIGEASGRTRSLFRLLAGVAFGTAVASFVYEIAWIRMLSLVLGSATHSFELMLSAFIFGLAFGSFWVRGRADTLADPLRTLGLVQWVMGFLALATLPVYLSSFGWTASLLHAFARSDGGYLGFTLARYAICLAVMLPATFCAGITLPLIIRILLADGVGERAIGSIYAWNTLGSILGVSLAGLVLMPWIGLKWMLVGGAVLDMGFGVLVFLSAVPRRPRLAFAAAAGTVAVAALAGAATELSPHLLVSGVYRTGFIPAPDSEELLFYRDGRTASVSAVRNRASGDVSLSTNGKPDASLEADWLRPCAEITRRRAIVDDSSTQTLAPLIALAHAPRARVGAVIGQGSGMWSHFLLASPTLEKLVTIEIEPEMVHASRVFYPANHRVFDDPRSHFVIDDAKSYFAASNQRFDVILSEPSNPWVSGVAGLFTAEFYERVGRYLARGGVFGQWLHLYEMRDGLVLSVLSAIHQSFASYRVFLTGAEDILILASNEPALPTPDWSVFMRPPVTDDLCGFIPFTPGALEATSLVDRTTLAPLLDEYGGPNSDFFPVLDLGAEKARFLQAPAQGFKRLSSDRFDIAAVFSGRRTAPSGERESPLPGIPRVRALALGASLRDPAEGAPGETLEAVRKQKAFRIQLWNEALRGSRPPADWRLWTQNALEVEQDLNGGTAGTAHEEFFELAWAFMRTHAAPSEAWDALRFRHGLATWNFAEAVEPTDRLVSLAVQQVHWVSPDELRAGAAVAHLLQRDPQGARRTLDRLKAVSSMGPDDLRLRLLHAFVERAERASPRTAAR